MTKSGELVGPEVWDVDVVPYCQETFLGNGGEPCHPYRKCQVMAHTVTLLLL